MAHRTHAIMLAAVLAMALASAATAQHRPTVAILPAQYFKADAQSADNVTRALVEQFRDERYNVIPMDRSQRVFQSLGFRRTTAISDTQLRQLGRRIGADLVARPQLIGVGIPLNREATTSDSPNPKAV